MSTVVEREYLTPPQVAELLGIGHDKVLRFIRQGELRAADLSSRRGVRPRWHISRTDLESFLSHRASTPPPESPRRRRRTQDEHVIEFYK